MEAVIYEAAKIFGMMILAAVIFAVLVAGGEGYGWRNMKTWKSAGIISFAFFMLQVLGLLLAMITFQPIQ